MVWTVTQDVFASKTDSKFNFDKFPQFKVGVTFEDSQVTDANTEGLKRVITAEGRTYYLPASVLEQTA